MTSYVLKLPGADRFVAALQSFFEHATDWLLYPSPAVARQRYRSGPHVLMLVLAFLVALPAFAYVAVAAKMHLSVTSLRIGMVVAVTACAASMAATWVLEFKWWKLRCADYDATCIEDEHGYFALSPIERRVVFKALRLNRRILRLTAQRDAALLPVMDAISADLAGAESLEDVVFLATLAGVVFPADCAWRSAIRINASLARNRLTPRPG